MSQINKPHSNIEFVDDDGKPTAVWYSVLDQLIRANNELQARVEALENP